MRPIDAILLFPAGRSALLLSEFEADQVLRLAWHHCKGYESAIFVNLRYLLRAADNDWTMPVKLAVPRQPGPKPPLEDISLAALQLLAGETMYETRDRRAAVAVLLPSVEAKRAAYELVKLRGRGNMLMRSHLEEICVEL